MPRSAPNQHAFATLRVGAASLLACLLSGSLILLSADTPSTLRTVTVSGCYCKCSEAKAHAGCVRICERPKFVGKQKIVKCAKPRLHLPVENHDAGPRFAHPGRAERASTTENPPGTGSKP